KGQLYCDVSSEMWARLSELGRFSGADREPPKPIDIVDIVGTVVSSALAEGNKQLAAWWYAVIPVTIFWELSSRHLSLAPGDPPLHGVGDAVANSEDYKIETDYGLLRYPVRNSDTMDGLGPDYVRFLEWWFEPLWSDSSNTV